MIKNNSEIRLGIIGAGNITRRHLEVVNAIKGISAVGITSRTKKKSDVIASEFNIGSVYTELTDLVEKSNPDALMVLVSAEEIYSVAKKAILCKKPLFIEKPPGFTPSQTKKLAILAKKNNVDTMVGCNRRYYSVFHKGLKIINDHGNLLGVSIEGHERFWRISERIKKTVRSNWIYANSIHTIDLLRFFGGEPKNIFSIKCSRLENEGDQFASVMQFESGALGNYVSHWYSPGGWSVQLFGEGVSVKFEPLEEGVWSDKNLKQHSILPEEQDIKFKGQD